MVAVPIEDAEWSAVAALTGVVDDLLSMSFTSLPTRDLLALARAVETQLRRLPVFDHALIAEMHRRDVAGAVGARDTAKVLVDALRIAAGEAKLRVKTAADVGPRFGFTGQPLPALFPAVAAAQATGDISPIHARIVTSTIDRLPSAVQAEHGQATEQALVEHAHTLTPDQLRVAARRLSDHLDPDGTLRGERDRARLRGVTFASRADGSARGSFEFTPRCGARWQTLFDSFTKPVKADDGVRDPRTAAQRRHDAMEEIADLLLRSGDLSDCGGTPATVIVTMTLADLETRNGLATTAHGGTTSVAEALDLACEAEIIPVVVNDFGGIISHGRTRRVASPRQRVVLAGRDRGCSFPGCDIPPAWTQAHHIQAWQDRGETTLDNLTLVCGHHHRELQRLGWTCHMNHGTPRWTPPPWNDPTLTPQRNNTLHLERLLPPPPTGPTPASSPPT
jgi:Domain of unknown function (DUF222)/HNH endonuclease